jgi:hypothetical protein
LLRPSASFARGLLRAFIPGPFLGPALSEARLTFV